MLSQWTSSERIVRHSQDACFRIRRQEHGFDGSSQLAFVHLDSLDRTSDALASVRRGHSRPRATGSTSWVLRAACRRRCQAKAL